MTTSSTTSERRLFQRPDGSPYDVWIQTNFDHITLTRLKALVEEHGGHVTDFGTFPEHGFLFLDPTDPNPLYEVKTAFHKPVERGKLPYTRTGAPKSTPLRHVLSYHFIEAVIAKGSWNHVDLLRWGFAAPMTKEDIKDDPKKAVERFRKELQLGLDPEMEKGWILATGRVFDSYDPAYRFTEEFNTIDEEVSKRTPPPNLEHWKIWLRGRVVAECRLNWQLKFYLHDDIPNDEEEKLIRTIMENGGSTCYESSEANVTLVGCKESDIEEDAEIVDWMESNATLAKEKQPYPLLKFTSWVARCVEVGDWRDVDNKTADVTRAYKAFQRAKLRMRDKGKGKVTSSGTGPVGRKRKRGGDETTVLAHLNGSPAKKRKLQEESLGSTQTGLNGSISRSRMLLGNLSGTRTELGSGSTVRPTRIFTGIAVPNIQPSPIKHDGNVSSLMLAPEATSRSQLMTHEVDDEQQENNITVPSDYHPEGDHNSVGFDPHPHSRFSAASVLTVDTATSSKAGNTTTNTATTGTTKSARSVGPSNPPNAQQVARPSTSIGVDTEVSGASRGVLDPSLEPPAQKSGQGTRPTLALDSDFEPDDRAGDVILSFFSSAKDVDSRKNAFFTTDLNEFEEKLLSCWRQMSELGYSDGTDVIEDLVNNWPDIERGLRQKSAASRDRKGKGRVSFHEPAREDTDQDYVLETDLDEVKEKLPQRIVTNVDNASNLRASNLRAYARQRGVSKTPESVVSSDEETSQEKEKEHASARSGSGKAKAVRDRSGSPIVHKVSSRSKVTSRNISPRVITSSRRPRRGGSKEPNTSQVEAASAPTQDIQDNESVPGNEEDGELAPLPSISTKMRPSRKRVGSVISEGSATKDVPPRRGRSASAAPQDKAIEPTMERPIKAAPSSQRKVAMKTTGGKATRRK